MQPRTVAIVASSVRTGRCRWCAKKITLAVTASRPGKPSRTRAFSFPKPFPLSTDYNETTRVTFETWPLAAQHFIECPNHPANAPSRRSGAHA